MARTTLVNSAAGKKRAPVKGVVGFLVVMEFGSGMLQAWYPVLLTAIGAEFGVNAALLNLVTAATLLATVVLVPIMAKLGDRYGHKRLLVIATILVALGSIIVALAPNFGILLIGRALQAALAAFLPLEFAIVRDRDEKSAGRSIGKLVGALTFGVAIGSVAAGVLYSAIGDLRAVLWIPAIFLAICVPVVIFLVPESQARAAGRMDWGGASLLGLGLVAVLGGVSSASTGGWGNPATWAAILGGLALLTAWVMVEKRVTDPFIDINLLTRGGIGLPIFIGFLFGAQIFGSQTATAVYLLTDPAAAGFGLGLTPAVVGVIMLLSALGASVAAALSDRLARRVGVGRATALGGILIALGYVGMIASGGSVPLAFVSMFLNGVGSGVVVAVLPTIIVKRAPADSVGIASAMYNTARTAAGAIAGVFIALLMASVTVTIGSGESAVVTTDYPGFVAVWCIGGALSLLIVVFALRLTKSTRDDAVPEKIEATELEAG